MLKDEIIGTYQELGLHEFEELSRVIRLTLITRYGLPHLVDVYARRGDDYNFLQSEIQILQKEQDPMPTEKKRAKDDLKMKLDQIVQGKPDLFHGAVLVVGILGDQFEVLSPVELSDEALDLLPVNFADWAIVYGVISNIKTENRITEAMTRDRVAWFRNLFPPIISGKTDYVFIDGIRYEMDDLTQSDKERLEIMFPEGPQKIS